MSRPNYAALLQDDEDEVDTASAALPDHGAESGSDFAPEKHATADAENNDESSLSAADEDELMEEDPSEPEDVIVTTKASTSRGNQKRPKNSVTSIPSISLTRQSTLPSVHHRHRAMPLYYKTGQVERLAKRPRLFKPDELALTNACGANRVVFSRVGKSWSLNAGPGPLWELAEDRGWYKECAENAEDNDERQRRPRVHTDVRIHPRWEIFSSA